MNFQREDENTSASASSELSPESDASLVSSREENVFSPSPRTPSLPQFLSKRTSSSNSDDRPDVQHAEFDDDSASLSPQIRNSTSPLPSFPYPATTQSTRELDQIIQASSASTQSPQHSPIRNMHSATSSSREHVEDADSSSVEPSPHADVAIHYAHEYDYDASSDEDMRTSPSVDTEVDDVGSLSVATEDRESVVEYEPPPPFDISANEGNLVRQKENTHAKLPRTREKQTVCLRASPLLKTLVVCPVKNPRSGNLIVCAKQRHGFVISEFDVKSRGATVSMPILSKKVKRKMTSMYKSEPVGVSNVIAMATGVQWAQQRARVHVAALVDFDVASTDKGTTLSLAKRMLVVWQWGHGVNQEDTALLSIIEPPQTDSGFRYNASSLLTADGLCFFSGQDRNGLPRVLVSSAVKASWLSTNVGASASTITSMAVTSAKEPYLAVALSNNSVRVWNYASAKNGMNMSSVKGEFLSLAFVLKAKVAPVELRTTESGDVESKQVADSNCTYMEWSAPFVADDTPFLLLALVFSDSVAAFCVPLPSENGKHSSLDSFAVGRLYRSGGPRNAVTWLNLGPHCSPCLGVLCAASKESVSSSVLLLSIDLPTGDESIVSTDEIRVVCETPLPQPSCEENDRVGLVGLDSVGCIACCCGSRLDSYSPRLMSTDLALEDPYFLSMRQLVISEPQGLDSFGSKTADSCFDDVLLVSTTLHFASVGKSGIPTLRHLLYRIYVEEASQAATTSPNKDNLDTTDGENLKGGLPYFLCELKYEGASMQSAIQPHRIRRCRGSGDCAVLFTAAIGDEDLSLNSSMLILLDTDAANKSSPILYQCAGRDVALLSKGPGDFARAVILSNDGASVNLLTRDVRGEGVWEEILCSRSLFSSNDDDCEGRRLFVVSSGSRVSLVVVGFSSRDNKVFVSRGPFLNPEESPDWLSKMLPISDVRQTLLLEPGEHVVTVRQLPDDGVSRCCIAIATQQRVIIADLGDLDILMEAPARVTSCSLTPIGSHTVAYCSDDSRVYYLSCLGGKFAGGALATLQPQTFCGAPCSLLALRPDRILYVSDEVQSGFSFPVGKTKPALMLEPLVANALCTKAEHYQHTERLVHVATEKFGRKLLSLAHETGGTGNLGAGVTPVVLEMLSSYGFKGAGSWLLTGSPRLERTSNPKIVPCWASMQSKALVAQNSDAILHFLANGDPYLSEYVNSPDHNMVSSLPRDSDPSAQYASEFARQAMKEGSIGDAIKISDFTGFESSERDLLILSLALGLDPFSDTEELLRSLRKSTESGATSSISGLVLDAKIRRSENREPTRLDEGKFDEKDMKHLAPSVQRSCDLQRSRPRLIGERASRLAVTGQNDSSNSEAPLWNSLFNESHHIWNEGPSEKRENLLALDRIEDWLGRRQPTLLGEEGSTGAFERGEKRLAYMLAKDDDSLDGQSDTSHTQRLGWVNGVGEGRLDEDNLSAYFRMSEGGEEEPDWRANGLSDLTTFQHKGLLVGMTDLVSLQPTSSSVDDGEDGKAKRLYDLVFEKDCDGLSPAGLVIEVSRGGSLDVGILHELDRSWRKKCSIEFWYHLPVREKVSTDIVLVRRSVSSPEEDLSACCIAAERDRLLWELVVLPSGELEFKSNSGSSLLSTSESSNTDTTHEFSGDSKEDYSTRGLVSWQQEGGSGGWNHVCLAFSSQQHSDPSTCTVSVMMNGSKVVSGVVSILPPGTSDDSTIDVAMERTALAFCINPVSGLRITEVRVWSCERSEDDCKMMMFEYLREAETKRKLKVRIRNKQKVLSAEESKIRSLGGLLAPPPREGVQASRRRIRSEMEETQEHSIPLPSMQAMSGAEKSSETRDDRVTPSDDGTFQAITLTISRDSAGEDTAGTTVESAAAPAATDHYLLSPVAQSSTSRSSSLRLSDVVRRSAAAALIRGPPATRHFGGNRGGLSPTSLARAVRCGIGAIAICGAEKTVVFSHQRNPPGKTYPIGASGAIISDEIDHNGSEFLCCFFARDKRMMLFELSSRTVVVELQMTTKLNFWRYLPPQTHGHTLVFMIVTPVGGFHWTPLEASPRPLQVWNRGPDLQGKKIIVYEEGGSNGVSGSGARSAVALLLASVSTSNPVEAWIIPLGGDFGGFCVSNNVLGAAFCSPKTIEIGRFLPYVLTATRDLERNIIIEVADLVDDSSQGTVAVGGIVAHLELSLTQLNEVDFVPPSLAMGSWPEVICCSAGDIVVVAVRRKGLVAAYKFDGDSLELAVCEAVGNFIVDAAVTVGGRADVSAEVVLLVCDNDNSKDGRVISVFLE